MTESHIDYKEPEKSDQAFKTISEVSDYLDLPQHVLRFWETKFVQINPMKRKGRRRYYRPEDIEILKYIRHLLHNKGYTIKGVQNLLKEKKNFSAVNMDLPQEETSSNVKEKLIKISQDLESLDHMINKYIK